MSGSRGRAGAVPAADLRVRIRAAALVLAATMFPAAASAQQPPPPRDTAGRREIPVRRDTAAVRADSAQRPERGDSVRPLPPISPGGAFLRSLVIPGWGQARLGRNVTGGLFLLFEGMAGAMVWKASWQLEWARTRGKFVASHRQEREDWIVLLVFNHLMAGAEAYVSALLFDYPAALGMRRFPDGSTGVGVTIPLR